MRRGLLFAVFFINLNECRFRLRRIQIYVNTYVGVLCRIILTRFRMRARVEPLLSCRENFAVFPRTPSINHRTLAVSWWFVRFVSPKCFRLCKKGRGKRGKASTREISNISSHPCSALGDATQGGKNVKWNKQTSSGYAVVPFENPSIPCQCVLFSCLFVNVR